jgi:archaellum component FlaD/FlaE
MPQKTDNDKKEEPEFTFDEEAPDFEMEEEIPLFEEAKEAEETDEPGEIPPVDEDLPETEPQVIDIGDIEPDEIGGEPDEGPSVIEVEEAPSLEVSEAPSLEDETPPVLEDEEAPPFAVEEGPGEEEAPPFAVEEGPGEEEAPPFAVEEGPGEEEAPPFAVEEGPGEEEAPPFAVEEGPGEIAEAQEAPPFAIEETEDMQAPPFADAEEAPEDIDGPPFDAPAEAPGEEEAAPFLEEGEELPGFEEAGEGFPFGGPEESGDIGDISEKVVSIENKITQCDMGLTTIKEMDSQISEKAGEIDRHIQELLGIYELVTNEINPFVERFELKPRRIRKIIKKKRAAGAEVVGAEGVEPETVEPSEGIAPAAPASLPTSAPVGEGPVTRSMVREVSLQYIEDDPGSIAMLLRWLKFLMARVGREGLMEVLMHYEDTGWIGSEVRNKVIRYAKGILSGETIDHAPMDVKDHMISLYFITMLQGLEIDPRLYSSIYTDLAAMDIVD